MSNTQVQVSTQDVMSIAKAFSDSGMFPDIKSSAQAAVKIQAGKEFGIQPFAAMSGIHIIQGKPTIGAGLMAARVKGFGKYDYKVVKHDDKICSIDFMTKDKEVLGNSTFTIEDAKRAGTKNIDKFPKNMLFARAMSNGVKWYTPDIYETPVYVPEEMEHIQETINATAEVIEDKPTLLHVMGSNDTDIKNAITNLSNYKTVDELKTFKSTLPDYVVNSNEFKLAGGERFKQITNPTPTA